MGNEKWIPEKDRGTDYYIFNRLFMCRVKYIETFSPDYLRLYGHPASGDDVFDQETANEQVIRMLSIDQMVEYFRLGVGVQVVERKDTREIYERITDHLNAWKHRLTTSFHIRDAPVDDLLLLDKFASVVYPHAASFFTTEEVNSLIARKAGSVLKTNRQNILAAPKQESTTINPIVDKPERESMASTFSKTLPYTNDGVNKRWR